MREEKVACRFGPWVLVETQEAWKKGIRQDCCFTGYDSGVVATRTLITVDVFLPL